MLRGADAAGVIVSELAAKTSQPVGFPGSGPSRIVRPRLRTAGHVGLPERAEAARSVFTMEDPEMVGDAEAEDGPNGLPAQSTKDAES